MPDTFREAVVGLRDYLNRDRGEELPAGGVADHLTAILDAHPDQGGWRNDEEAQRLIEAARGADPAPSDQERCPQCGSTNRETILLGDPIDGTCHPHEYHPWHNTPAPSDQEGEQ